MTFNEILSKLLHSQMSVAARELTSDELRELDSWASNDLGPFRSIHFEAYRYFSQFSRGRSMELLRKHPRQFGLNVLASMSDDGWIREAACHNLAAIGGPALPYLMLRAYDWYGPTAKAALVAFRGGLPGASTTNLERCMLLLEAIDRAGKLDSEPVSALRVEANARPGFVVSVRRQVSGKPLFTLMRARFLGIDEDEIDILRQGLASGDPRMEAFCLSRATKVDPNGQLMDSLAASRSYRARLEVVEVAARLGRVEQLWSLLLDRHWRVRGAARFHLQNIGLQSFAAFYRQRFPAPSAVAGYGEVATETELLELESLLTNPLPPVRLQVLRAWRNRDIRGSATKVQSCLADTTASVVREAIRALRAFKVIIDSEVVMQSIRASHDPKVRRILVEALNIVPRWNGLRAWLDLNRNPEQFDRQIPLLSWFGAYIRYYSGPAPSELAEIEEMLQAVHDRLEPSVSAWIATEIEYWKRQQTRV